MAASSTALAQEVDLSEPQIFERSFFDIYNPRSALEMVQRIPAFSIRSGDTRRGLGNADANILINGARITGKTSARDRLSRIPANSVLRIEIVDGATLGLAGLSGPVANILIESSRGGTWEWSPRLRNKQAPNLYPFRVTVSGGDAILGWSVNLENTAFRPGHFGPETIKDEQGTLIEVREEDDYFYTDRPSATTELSWTPNESVTGNLKLAYVKTNFNAREISNRTAITAEGNDLQTFFIRGHDADRVELEGDIAHPFGKGRLKTLATYSQTRSLFSNQFRQISPQNDQSQTAFSQDADESEAILRSEYSWTTSADSSWEIALEAAFNTLETQSRFLTQVPGGELQEVALDGANTRITEDRAETSVTRSFSLSPKLDAQLSLAGEYSKLTQAGGLSREFYRPKGFASLNYRVNDRQSWTARIEREVDQLNFFDFASSVNVDDDLISTGNTNLVPSQSWIAEIGHERSFEGGHALSARVTYEKISDLVDRIPIGTQGDAVGNIDSAFAINLDVNATLKSELFGWSGTELTLNYRRGYSEVEDPLEGFTREINGRQTLFWDAFLRHDVPNTNWAFGAYLQDVFEAPVYRLDTVRLYDAGGVFGQVFVEHKDVFGLKIRADIINTFYTTDDVRFEVYSNRRDLGDIIRTENRERDFDPFFRLIVSGEF